MTVKGWTTETLKEHFEALLEEKDKALVMIRDADKEAVNIARTDAQKWRDNANEWRDAMNDREHKFLETTVFEIYKSAAEKLERERKENEALNKGREIGKKELIAIVVGGFSAAGLIVGLILKFLGK